MVLERLDAALFGITRTENWESFDWGMGIEKRAYGTYGDGGTGKGKIIWNVYKEYRI